MIRDSNRKPAAARVAAALALAAFGAAAPAGAQVGAIGSAPASAASGAESTARAPIFGQSALVMPQGSWSAGAYAGYTSGGVGNEFAKVDFTYSQLLVGAFFAPAEKVVLGVTAFPYAAYSISSRFGDEEESGFGDAQLFGRFQLWNSPDNRTSLAGYGNLGLPIGDDVFGANGASIGFGGALTHAAEQVTLHGSVGLHIPTDDADGNTTLGFTGALVYAAQPTLSLSAEILGATASVEGERFTSIDFAPGVRLRANDRLFLDGGLIFNISTSPGESVFDFALLIGATITK